VAVETVAVAATVAQLVAGLVAAYGAAVVSRVQDAAADATLGLGGRLLRRLLRQPEQAPAIEAAVQVVAEDPADEDRVAALRLQIRKALTADPQLAAELREMLQQQPGVSVTAVGERSVAVGHNSGIIQTGDNASARQGDTR